ncbi:MAG TPA: hypothetical protein VMV31_15235 [Terriglobales bacterium]|nr:hypothetical protein [Terriglobales bacterium]
MLRIRLSFFCNLGRNLHNLSGVVSPPIDLRIVWGHLYAAQQAIEELLGTEWFSPALRTASESGQKLVAALKAVTERHVDFNSEQPQMIGHPEAYAITSALNDFNTILNAEFSNSDTYYVSQKGAYDTSILIDRAERVFPGDLGPKVPAAVQEARAAGRCLAFELPSAAGFHTMRSLETVVRVYCRDIGAAVPSPDQRNLGVFINNIEAKKGANHPVVSTLRQIKDLHRNPLIHEVSLTLDEAIAIFGIAGSAIEAMLKEIHEPTVEQLLAQFSAPAASSPTP